jgi:hypothetical protein
MLKPHMVVLLNQNIFYGELLSPRPPHDGFRYFYSLFIGQRDGQREGFPWSQWQVSRESPGDTREIPDGALGKKKVSATVLRFKHGVPPPLARASDVSASH